MSFPDEATTCPECVCTLIVEVKQLVRKTLKRCGRLLSYRQNHTGPSNALWVFTPRVEGPHAHSQTHAACSRIHSGRRRKPPQCPLGRTGSIILPKTQGHSNAPTWTDLRPSHSVTKGQRPHNSTSVRPLEQSHSGGQRRGRQAWVGENGGHCSVGTSVSLGSRKSSRRRQ